MLFLKFIKKINLCSEFILKQLLSKKKNTVFQTSSHKVHKSQALMKGEIKVKLHFTCFSFSCPVQTSLFIVQKTANHVYPALNPGCHIKTKINSGEIKQIKSPFISINFLFSNSHILQYKNTLRNYSIKILLLCLLFHFLLKFVFQSVLLL